MRLVEYNYQIPYKGCENKVADFMSRRVGIRETVTPINLYKYQIMMKRVISGSLQIRNDNIFDKRRKIDSKSG